MRSSNADRCCQQYNRYLNQTWGEAGLLPAIASTADSALGHILSKGEHSNACHPSFSGTLTQPLLPSGTLFGASSHGSRPSGTSRYFSVDIGLIHFVGLDLNAAETSPRTIGLDKGQLAWLDQDLTAAAANREQVPWIVVTVSTATAPCLALVASPLSGPLLAVALPDLPQRHGGRVRRRLRRVLPLHGGRGRAAGQRECRNRRLEL